MSNIMCNYADARMSSKSFVSECQLNFEQSLKSKIFLPGVVGGTVVVGVAVRKVGLLKLSNSWH